MATGLAVVGLGAVVGGSILKGKAQNAAGRAQAEGLEFQSIAAQQDAEARSAAALFNAETAEENAAIAERSAVEAIDVGGVAELVSRFQTRDLIGRQTVRLAASGQQVGTGSAADLVSDTAAIGEFEALNIRFNAKQEAQRFKDQAFNFGRDADLMRLESQSALRAGATASTAALQAASSARKTGKAAQTASIIGGIGSAALLSAGAFGKTPTSGPALGEDFFGPGNF